MEILQIGCFSLAILFVILIILGAILSKIRNKKIAELMPRIGWQSIKNPESDLMEWVRIELNAASERYTAFGPVNEWDFLRTITYRDRMYLNNLWSKQDGDKTYFVIDVSDDYKTGTRGGRNVDFTIICMRVPQMSLPFFTLFPKIEFPKYRGWRYAISETHMLNLSDKIQESLMNSNSTPYHDPRLRPPLEMPSILDEEKPASVPQATDPPITFGSRLFNERFELYGKETERLRQFFDNEKLTALESMPQTFVDGGEELIFVYIPEHKPQIEEFEKFINDGIAIINAVSRGTINNDSHQ